MAMATATGELDPAVLAMEQIPFLQRLSISSFLPEGLVLTPASSRFIVHPALKMGIGRHPDGITASGDTTQADAWAAQITELLQAFASRVVAYSVDDLREGYKGDVDGLQIQQIDSRTHFERPRHHGVLKNKIADEHYGALEAVGIIEPAPHAKSACNTTFAQKRGADGKFTDIRVCVNYKPQNDLSHPQHTRFPLAEDLFQEIGDSRWFSKLDLKSGFHQIPVHPDSMDRTAFWWGGNLYRFRRMPFGLKQCPAAYQRVMDIELGRAGLSYCTKVFIDDILIHSPTFKQHLIDLNKVLACLARCNLRIHPGKSYFGIDTIAFLGYDVSQ
jgi:hypothetical protein